MPMFIAGLVLPLIVNSPIWLLGPAAVSATATGIGYLATAAGLYGLQTALTEKPQIPKAEDGKYNLRQAVPPPTYVLGRVKKASDYLALEETGGTAFHVFCPAGHRINRHVRFYAHEEELTLDPVTGLTTAPNHFGSTIRIRSRVGLDAETAFAEMVTAMPTIWTNDHRGDGMATVMMSVRSVDIEDQQKVFPNNMPLLTEELEGALLYDNREVGHDPADPETWEYSENLALMRAWHLTHPVGSKIKMEDMHWPDWNHAADICDQPVTNKAGFEEPRYHGGFWFKANTDPVSVGRTMDEAAELVIYETAEGKVGVHAGEFVEPDIRLTDADLRSVSFDVNKRRNSTVLAVRGRFTDQTKRFNEADAAIVGNPYIPEDDTERTRTVNNAAVQRHNHCQRLQTLKYIRANAPRVRFIADYEPAQDIFDRRYIRVHYLPKLDEAVIEIVGDRPKLSLSNLTIEFEGIVIPATLFNFVASTDEGNPPPPIVDLEGTGIPFPGTFMVTIHREVVGGGQYAPYALAEWNTADSDDLTTEIEWQPVAGGALQKVMASGGEIEQRTGYLSDGVEYRFRGRHWSGGTPGEWTSYIVLTAVANPTAPLPLVSASAIGGMGNAVLTVTSQPDPLLAKLNIYRVAAGGTLNKATDPLVTTGALPGLTFAAHIGDMATTNQLENPNFDTSGSWGLGSNWAIGSGVATHTAGVSGSLTQSLDATAAGGEQFNYRINITALSGGAFTPRLTGGTTVSGTAYTTTGIKYGTLTALVNNATYGVITATAAAGSVDDMILYKRTGTSIPQATYDLYVFAVNQSGIESASAAVVTNVIII